MIIQTFMANKFFSCDILMTNLHWVLKLLITNFTRMVPYATFSDHKKTNSSVIMEQPYWIIQLSIKSNHKQNKFVRHYETAIVDVDHKIVICSLENPLWTSSFESFETKIQVIFYKIIKLYCCSACAQFQLNRLRGTR